MNKYKFVPFTNVGSRPGNYSISFNSSGFFGINSGFYLKENIRNFKRVSFLFDKQQKAIALKFHEDKNAPNSFAIAHSEKQSTASVTARSFVVSNLLDKVKYNGQKTPKKIVDEKFGVLYVIELDAR